jgi:hypothetical protein
MTSSSWLLVIISSYSWSDLDEFSNFSFEILNAIAYSPLVFADYSAL